METSSLVIVLFVVTAGAVLIWAIVSKRKTEKRMQDDTAPKSTLAKDGPGPNPVEASRIGDPEWGDRASNRPEP
ncbi:hypothetical protein ACFORG_17715 [Lutimaribacter marinistellae]|uniref:Uncharacterized protein n=1 Tax=Lutimaribacter marinistellae TaxID=1820329 RepID=A0ABV7TMA9_9RHOB